MRPESIPDADREDRASAHSVDEVPDDVADAIVALEAAGYAVQKSDILGHWTVAGTVNFTEQELIRAAQSLGAQPRG